MSSDQAIQKGLKHLSGSEEIIGNIVAYCVNAHKADPSTKTMDKIRQYVTDTANSVCGHVLTIAHNINSIIDKESKEIEEMSYQLQYVQHRIKSHQTYMSELYMTKFQTLPRPKPTIHILRETIPTDQLPKYARPKKPWVRHGVFDYSILDSVGSDKPRKQASGVKRGEKDPSKIAKQQSTTNHAIAPKAAVVAFNPYESMMNGASSSPQTSVDVIAPPTMSASANQPSSPKTNASGKSLYQRQKEKAMKKSLSTAKLDFKAPPPSFSGAAPPSFSSAYDKPKSQAKPKPKTKPKPVSNKKSQSKPVAGPKPPQPPAAAVPPPVPVAAVPPPVPSNAVPPPVPSNAVPPPVPPVPPQPVGAGPPAPPVPPVPPVPPQ